MVFIVSSPGQSERGGANTASLAIGSAVVLDVAPGGVSKGVKDAVYASVGCLIYNHLVAC